MNKLLNIHKLDTSGMSTTKGIHEGHFYLPTAWDLLNIKNPDSKVAVISVFGKSSVESNGCKGSVLELLIGTDIFKRDLISPIKIDEKHFTGIEGFYDTTRRIIFLHLTGVYDAYALVTALEKLKNEIEEKGFLVSWLNLKLNYARSLLFLFSISHILILCHPTHIFDISYILLFRTLDIVRSKSVNYISEMLNQVPDINKDWANYGRLCSPRVLFVFSSRHLPHHVLKVVNDRTVPGSTQRSARGSSQTDPIRKLEHSLEDQIYKLLRKSRVITNISANSLFAVPNNQAYVYILDEIQEESNIDHTVRTSLMSQCGFIDLDANEPAKVSVNFPQVEAAMENSNVFASVTALSHETASESLSFSILSSAATEKKCNREHSFIIFMKQHIDLVLGRGFDDNVGRHSGPSFFEAPKAEVWFKAVSHLYNVFIGDSADSKLVMNLRNHIETEVKFSEFRCSKAYPLAIRAYREGLPPHYTSAQHQAKLSIAINVLALQAKGPKYDHYEAQLIESCDKIWLDGRVGCEKLSLMGNTCQHPKHVLPDDVGNDSLLPVLSHKSGVEYISYCNCGKRSGSMEDPFTPWEANVKFYDQLSDVCCGRLENRFHFPIFTPDSVDAAVQDMASLSLTLEEKKLTELTSQDEKQMQVGTILKDLQLPSGCHVSPSLSGLSGGTGGTDVLGEEGSSPKQLSQDSAADNFVAVIGIDENKRKKKKTDNPVKAMKCLSGMLHKESPPFMLPRYSSWSLVCLGPSSLYSHNAGISDPKGFITGSNFLLPWDVPVKIEDKSKWPAIADCMGKKGLNLKNKKNRTGDINEFNVKIFLGVEYQCLRGHRFMMASPDRPLKATPAGLVKDTADRVANSDMPLYFPCPCSRSGAPVNGQLMRVHVVTPKAPVNIILNPHIQPNPEPCQIFIPQPNSYPPIKLSQSTYWVLRLPFVYAGEDGPYYGPHPNHPSPELYGRLLKGCYRITQVMLDR